MNQKILTRFLVATVFIFGVTAISFLTKPEIFTPILKPFSKTCGTESLKKKMLCVCDGMSFPDKKIGSTEYYCLGECSQCRLVMDTEKQDPAATEKAGWKIYTNTKYGFELKYPKEYAVSENGIQQANGLAYKFESINISSSDGKAGFIMHIDISSDPNILVGPDDREIKETKVVNGIKFAGFSDLGMGDRFGYTAKYGNYYYRLDTVFDTGLFDQILSTFKFTK
jgi:hypothetical protein